MVGSHGRANANLANDGTCRGGAIESCSGSRLQARVRGGAGEGHCAGCVTGDCLTRRAGERWLSQSTEGEHCALEQQNAVLLSLAQLFGMMHVPEQHAPEDPHGCPVVPGDGQHLGQNPLKTTDWIVRTAQKPACNDLSNG